MSDTYLEPSGIIVPLTSLKLPRSRALASLLDQHDLPFVHLIECRQFTNTCGETAETIVFDTEVERPQKPVNGIHRNERLAATFAPADETYPEVCALRNNFPRVPHTNLRMSEYPRSLCLYDQPWAQIALRWTPTAFVERIRFWLAETAKGTLHREDQPLEPLIFGSGYKIILPPDLFEGKQQGDLEELQVALAAQTSDCRVLVAKRGKWEGGLAFLALSLVSRPQTHGVIRHNHHNLQELEQFLESTEITLLTHLRSKIPDWNTNKLRDKRLLLVLGFPMTRDGKNIVEASHLWVFLPRKPSRRSVLILAF